MDLLQMPKMERCVIMKANEGELKKLIYDLKKESIEDQGRHELGRLETLILKIDEAKQELLPIVEEWNLIVLDSVSETVRPLMKVNKQYSTFKKWLGELSDSP